MQSESIVSTFTSLILRPNSGKTERDRGHLTARGFLSGLYLVFLDAMYEQSSRSIVVDSSEWLEDFCTQ